MPKIIHHQTTYPNAFLDQLQERFNVKNDYKLGQLINIDASTLRKIRARSMHLSAHNLIDIYDATGWTMEAIRSLLYRSNVTRPFVRQPQVPIRHFTESIHSNNMTKLTDSMKQYPQMFLNWIMREMCLKTDADLARLMQINQSTISRIRSQAPHAVTGKTVQIADTHLLQLYDATGFSIEQMRSVLYQQKFTRDVTPKYVTVQMQARLEEKRAQNAKDAFEAAKEKQHA